MRHTSFYLAVAVVAALCAGSRVQAAIVFNVDPSQSSLDIDSLTFFGAIPGSEQSPGSWTTSLSGSLFARVTDSSIQLRPQTTIVAGIGGNWSPGADFPINMGQAETHPDYVNAQDPANYASTIVLPDTRVLQEAIRGLQFSIYDIAPKPLVGDTFLEAGSSVDILTGTAFYSIGSTSENGPITDLGEFGLGTPTLDVLGDGSLVRTGNLLTLTLPVSYTLSFSATSQVMSGTIVATANVPEPTTGILLLSAALPAIVIARRFGKRATG